MADKSNRFKGEEIILLSIFALNLVILNFIKRNLKNVSVNIVIYLL